MKKYMQITGGRGPVECARAVARVAQAFAADMAKRHPLVALELIDSEPHNQYDGCYMSMTFCLSAEVFPQAVVQAVVKEWEGTVQWIASSNPYRPNHKRKNWFVGVRFFDEVELADIKDCDITYDTCRSAGAGGQNVNKVETAVRATHIPSGMSVKCSDQRSQAQNKALARERLLLKLHQLNEQALAETKSQQWNCHTTLQRGNPVKKFTGAL